MLTLLHVHYQLRAREQCKKKRSFINTFLNIKGGDSDN